MSADTYIFESLARHTRYLDRVSGSVSKDIGELIDELDKEIQIRLLAKDQINTPGPNDIVRVRRDLAQIMDDEFGMDEVIETSMRDLASSELQYMENLLDEATVAERLIVRTSPELVYSTFTDVPMLLTSTSGVVTRETIAEAIDRFTDKAQRQVMMRLASGIAQGKSNQEMAREIHHMLGTGTRRQAEALTRTIVTHVGTQARKPALRANSEIIIGEEYVATLDKRTTLVCMGFDGQVFLVDEGPQPPLHYNCRSIRSPKIDPKLGLSGLTGERPFVGEDEAGNITRGVVDGRVTSAGFLRKQPRTFQDDVLGPERAKLFRSGRVSLSNFTDNAGRTIPLSELTDNDGNYIIPRGDN